MLQALQIAKVMEALVRGVKSRTTKDQWMGNVSFLILACVVGTSLILYGGMSEDAVLGGIIAAQTLIGPYFSRMTSWLHSRMQGKVKVDPSKDTNFVRHEGGKRWRGFNGTLMDAREEGWDYGLVDNGIEVGVKFMEKTGMKVQVTPSKNMAFSGEATERD